MKEEALKLADDLQKHFNCYNEYSDMIRRLVEELDKQEYRRTHEGFSTIIDKAAPKKRCEPICKPSVCDCIRAKPLSDEEIMSEWEKSKDEVDFARAILRKAQ